MWVTFFLNYQNLFIFIDGKLFRIFICYMFDRFELKYVRIVEELELIKYCKHILTIYPNPLLIS